MAIMNGNDWPQRESSQHTITSIIRRTYRRTDIGLARLVLVSPSSNLPAPRAPAMAANRCVWPRASLDCFTAPSLEGTRAWIFLQIMGYELKWYSALCQRHSRMMHTHTVPARNEIVYLRRWARFTLHPLRTGLVCTGFLFRCRCASMLRSDSGSLWRSSAAKSQQERSASSRRRFKDRGRWCLAFIQGVVVRSNE
jgi:hypothetical protein